MYGKIKKTNNKKGTVKQNEKTLGPCAAVMLDAFTAKGSS
jgi:hypothetical protein